MTSELRALFATTNRYGNIGGREQRAAQREFFDALAVGKKAVMADTVKPVRQRVQQEASYELVGRQCHDLVFVVVPIVAPVKADPVGGKRNEPAVGDGDAMRVAAEISQHLFGPAEWWLGIDDPVGPSELIEPLGERAGIGEMGEIAKEAKLASREGGL